MHPSRKCLCVLTSLVVLPGLPAAEPAEEAGKLARDLVALRVEAGRADAAWRTERELLSSTVAALQEKAARAEEKMELAKAKSAKDREDVDAVRARVQGARDDLQAFEARLAALGTRLAALRPALPPRLAEALEMAFRTLGDPAQPAAERMRQALNILNRCTQFNRLVTTGEEVLALDGEPNARSYAVLYWGLSHGYALDRAGRKAWLGTPVQGAWRWEAHPEAYDRVAELLAVAADQADPAFVPVPAPGPKLSAESARDRKP